MPGAALSPAPHDLDDHTVLDLLPSPLAVLDVRGVIVKVNRAWRTFRQEHGLALPGDGLGGSYLDQCDASGHDDLKEVASGVRQVLAGQVSEYVQVCACRAAERWCQVRITPLGTNQGHVLVMHEDVTARIVARDELQEQSAFVRGLISSSPDCLQVLNLQGELLWINDAGLKMMEIQDFGDLRCRPITALWSADRHDELRRALEAAAHGGRGHLQGFSPTLNGTAKFWDVVFTPIHIADDQVPAADQIRYLLATARDLTALRAAQQEALSRAEETSRVLHSIQDAFYALDEEWRFTYLNPRASQMTSRSLDEPSELMFAEYPGSPTNLST